MNEKRFGLTGTARYRVYQWLAFVSFLWLCFGGDRRWIAFFPLGIIAGWMMVFDSIGRDGKPRFLGLRPSLFGSIFGKKTGDQ
jgi:hypothetical protein